RRRAKGPRGRARSSRGGGGAGRGSSEGSCAGPTQPSVERVPGLREECMLAPRGPVLLKFASLLGFVFLVGVLIALIYLRSLSGAEPIGITLQVLAVLLMLWARATFGVRSLHAAADPTGGGLVTTGPSRFLRHPIYAAILYFMAVGIVSHLSWVTAGLGLVALR